MNRRSFCASLAASAFSAMRLAAEEPRPAKWIAELDHARVMKATAIYLQHKPETVTAIRAERSPAGPHDFYSESDYFWPDPKSPAGPYRERDGVTNSTNFTGHRAAMIRLSVEMPALTSAWLLTKGSKYLRASEAHLLAWFVHPETRMTPNLEHAQAVRQGVSGRSYGIIDTLHLVEVARAASFVLPRMKASDAEAVRAWFREYLVWLQTSEKGMKERDATNNHAVCWALQVAEFARLVGDEAVRGAMRERYRTVLLQQMAANGSYPREIARTKPYGYSIFNFDAMSALCWSLGGEAEVRFSLPDGRGMCRGAEFLFPYLKDKSAWPYAHDVQHWDQWPVRSAGLLFCGLACGKDEYLELWKRLDPDPSDPEIIRNDPLRQPLLWVS